MAWGPASSRGATVTVASPVTPPALATMSTDPTWRAVTTPLASTVAMAVLRDSQVKSLKDVKGLDAASRAEACSHRAPPTGAWSEPPTAETATWRMNPDGGVRPSVMAPEAMMMPAVSSSPSRAPTLSEGLPLATPLKE